jgi:hypothetical protein
MKKILTSLAATGLLALGACGGGGESSQNASATENVALPADDLTATDNAGSTDALGTDANALGTTNATGTDANLTTDANAVDANASVNATTGNSQ